MKKVLQNLNKKKKNKYKKIRVIKLFKNLIRKKVLYLNINL